MGVTYVMWNASSIKYLIYSVSEPSILSRLYLCGRLVPTIFSIPNLLYHAAVNRNVFFWTQWDHKYSSYYFSQYVDCIVFINSYFQWLCSHNFVTINGDTTTFDGLSKSMIFELLKQLVWNKVNVSETKFILDLFRIFYKYLHFPSPYETSR